MYLCVSMRIYVDLCGSMWTGSIVVVFFVVVVLVDVVVTS